MIAEQREVASSGQGQGKRRGLESLLALHRLCVWRGVLELAVDKVVKGTQVRHDERGIQLHGGRGEDKGIQGHKNVEGRSFLCPLLARCLLLPVPPPGAHLLPGAFSCRSLPLAPSPAHWHRTLPTSQADVLGARDLLP